MQVGEEECEIGELRDGEAGKAKEQLAEIAKRCGVACEDYQLLADEIAKFEKTAG